MLITNLRVAELALKCMAKELTDIDIQELNEYINYSEENRKHFLELTYKTSFRDKLAVYTTVKDNKAAQEDKLRAALFEKNKTWQLRNYRPLVYAASIILLITVATYFYRINNKPVLSKTTARTIESVHPGGNRAILTLDNGEQINLSDAKNGQLSEQYGISIQKSKDGEVVFALSNKESQSLSENGYNTISTPLGGQYQIVLSDGSKIWLNSGSSLQFPTRLGQKRREVILTGEGYFEIAHNSNSLFQVFAGNIEIQVLGTKFNVNAYKEEKIITTTLIQGAVKIGLNKNNNIANMEQKDVILKVRDQSSVFTDGNTKVTHNVDVYASVAWMKGIFYFKHATVQDVMRQLSRWYKIEVEYKGEIPAISFSGEMLKSASLEQILEVLQESKINFKVEGNKIMVSK